MTVVFPKSKSRMTFVCCSQNLENVLDVCTVADSCVFVCNAADGEEAVMNAQTDLILTCLRTQGLPTSIGFIGGMASGLAPKMKTAMKKYATRFVFRVVCHKIDCCRRSSERTSRSSMTSTSSRCCAASATWRCR